MTEHRVTLDDVTGDFVELPDLPSPELVTRRLLCFEWFNPIAEEIKKDAATFGFEVLKVSNEVPEGEVFDWELTLRGTAEQLDAFATFYGDEDGPLEYETD